MARITNFFAVFLVMCASRLLGAMPGVRATEAKNTLMVMAFSRHGARAPTNLEYAD